MNASKTPFPGITHVSMTPDTYRALYARIERLEEERESLLKALDPRSLQAIAGEIGDRDPLSAVRSASLLGIARNQFTAIEGLTVKPL